MIGIRQCESRRGQTLIEVMLVVAIQATLGGSMVVGLATLITASQRAEDELEFRRSLARLSVQFRQDATSAVGLETQGERGEETLDQVTFTLPDGDRITYAIDSKNAQITRESKAGESAPQREQYIFNRNVDFSLQVQPRPGGSLVTLTLLRKAAAETDSHPAAQTYPILVAIRSGGE